MNRRALHGVAGILLAIALMSGMAVALAQGEAPPVEDTAQTVEEQAIELPEIEAARANSPAPKAAQALPDRVTGADSVYVPSNKVESEGNNTFRTADPIEVGDVIYGKIGYKTDRDFFVVNTAPYMYRYLLIDLDAQVDRSQLDALMCLYAANKDLVTCDYMMAGDDSMLYMDASHYAGDVDWDMTEKMYISVEDLNYPNEGGAAYYYTLSVSQPLLVSANVDGMVSGIPFTKADILAWQDLYGDQEKWSLFFDASDMGISGDLEAIALDFGVVFALGTPQDLNLGSFFEPDIQRVKPQDVLRYEPGLISGRLSWRYRGADYGLTSYAERIDALAWGGQYASTVGTAMSGVTGASYQDEDLFNIPYGTLFFDGSQVPGLAVEDVVGAQQEGSDLWLVIQGGGTIDGHRVNQSQIFAIAKDGRYAWHGIVWDGRLHNFNYPIDAIAK